MTRSLLRMNSASSAANPASVSAVTRRLRAGGERGRAAKCGGGRAARPALCSPKKRTRALQQQRESTHSRSSVAAASGVELFNRDARMARYSSTSAAASAAAARMRTLRSAREKEDGGTGEGGKNNKKKKTREREERRDARGS